MLSNLPPEALLGFDSENLSLMEDRLRQCADCSVGGRCDSPWFKNHGEYPVFRDGQLIWDYCEKWEGYAIRKALKLAGVGPRFMDCSLDNFKPQTRAQEKLLARLSQYCAAFPSDRGLFIAGPVGTGKTHLAVGILRAVKVVHNIQGLFAMVPAVLAKIRAAVGRGDEDAAEILERYQQCHLLVLDDMGAERVTDWVREQLFLLIDARYQMMLPTIITTNDTIEELEEHVGQRIVSRIMEMCDGVILDGQDYRKTKIIQATGLRREA